jgi:uncharacterized YceG family protein
MSPSRRGDPGRPRTAEERERDRLERERRRSRQRGESSPLGDDDAAPLFGVDGAGPPPSYEEVWSEPPPADPGPPPPPDPEFPPYDPAPGYAPPPGAGEYPPWPADADSPPVYAEPPPEPSAPRVRRPREAAGGAPTPGLPAALGGAAAAVSGAAARARARLAKKPSEPAPEAGEPAKPRAGSLPRSPRPRTPRAPRRTPAGERPAIRPRSGPRTAPVSRTKRNPTSSTGSADSRRGRIGAVVALAAVVFALWFLFSLFQPFKGAGHGTVAIDIPRGASSGTIATLLADRGVISSPFFFKLRATLTGKRSALESGHFDLRRDMSYGAALDALTGHRGQAAQITVTIPEGDARTEIAKIAQRDGVTGDYVKASVHSHVLKPSGYGATRAAHSLEGFLFPATYFLLPGDPASKLVNAQLMAFQTNIAKVDLKRARSKHLSTYDVLTIASMIEREAQRASERPLIAAVIYNRLHSGMPLGIDATIRYAINDYSRPLTDSDLRLSSPYNTRLHKGLPPTPIGNPGLASIQAAAHPAAVPYMYYVVKPGACGQHAFSTTFAQFQQDVARYNSARTAKGGKSPSTCAP